MTFRLRGRKSALATAVDRVFTQPEPLEKRELMSFSAHVNFQPAAASTPSGYVADTGKTYGSRNGLTYGWDKDISADTRNKDSSLSKDQRYDTFTHMQRSGSRTWNIAVPNGTYSVHIASGDAGFYDSAFRVAAEGKTVVNGNPTSSNRWVEGTQTVTVSDGKLTISNASGASNNKIDFVDITQTSTSTSGGTSSGSTGSSSTTLKIPPAAPSSLSLTSPSSTSIKLTWNDNSVREDGYKIYRSTDGSSFSQVATVGASVTSYTNSALSSSKKYYYKVTGYNAYGNSTYTNTASLTTGSSGTSSGGGTSTGGSSSPSSQPTSGYFDGVFVGGDDPNKIIPILRDLGAKAVRLWGSVSDWSSPTDRSHALARIY
jgi:hypothetical protein